MKTDVDFGCAVRGSESMSIYRGMNPEFVRRVHAKRRREAAKAQPVERTSTPAVQAMKEGKPVKKRTRKPVPPLVLPDIFETAEQAIQQGFSSVKEAREIVANIFGIPVERLNEKTRRHHIYKARHAAICAVKLRWPDASLPFIAQRFDVDHTTVMHVLRRNGIDTAQPQSHAA